MGRKYWGQFNRIPSFQISPKFGIQKYRVSQNSQYKSKLSFFCPILKCHKLLKFGPLRLRVTREGFGKHCSPLNFHPDWQGSPREEGIRVHWQYPLHIREREAAAAPIEREEAKREEAASEVGRAGDVGRGGALARLSARATKNCEYVRGRKSFPASIFQEGEWPETRKTLPETTEAVFILKYVVCGPQPIIPI